MPWGLSAGALLDGHSDVIIVNVTLFIYKQ